MLIPVMVGSGTDNLGAVLHECLINEDEFLDFCIQ